MSERNEDNHKPLGPYNLFARFIAPNPPTSFNPKCSFPCIHPTAFIGPFSTIIGDVNIGENVFVAPNVTIRADEGTPFFIGRNTNIQDGVILHGLNEGRVTVNGKKFSIFIGEDVSCAHGCLIHGPCMLGNKVFVGFNAIVYNAIISEGSFISTNAIVTDGVKIASNRFVPPGAVIDTQAKADVLGPVPADKVEFAREVQHVNREFPAAYAMTFGSSRGSFERQFGSPVSPPPAIIPPKPANSYIIDCMYSFTYVWPTVGRAFWFYPTRLEYGEVSGYIWNGSLWTFYGFDPAFIDAVACSPVPTPY